MNQQTALPQKRRKKHINRHSYRPRLPCPACTFERLIDTGQSTRSITFMPGEDGYLNADYYQKCSSCKLEIGIRKIE
jgi:hypothetical protein